MFACIHVRELAPADLEVLLSCANSFSPTAEVAATDTVVFSLSGLGLLYPVIAEIAHSIARRLLESGFKANVAIAQNADAAILAARNFTGITLIPEKAAAALARLDVNKIPLTPEVADIFRRWGIRTLGELAALPEAGLVERLGPAAARLRKLAQGTVERPLIVSPPELEYKERVELDHATELLDPLVFVLARSLREMCEKARSHGMACDEIRIALGLEDGTEHVRTLRLPTPIIASKTLLKLVQIDLEAHPPAAAVVGVSLAFKTAPPRRAQGGLFVPPEPEPQRLELTLARIRALIGDENLGVPELLNTHRPDAFRLTRYQLSPGGGRGERAEATRCRLAFRYFRPALEARVETDLNRPARLTAHGIRGRVSHWAGPWRTSGDWWTDNPWNRDEWDVALEGGAVYRLYSEPDGRWFVEGSYD